MPVLRNWWNISWKSKNILPQVVGRNPFMASWNGKNKTPESEKNIGWWWSCTCLFFGFQNKVNMVENHHLAGSHTSWYLGDNHRFGIPSRVTGSLIFEPQPPFWTFEMVKAKVSLKGSQILRQSKKTSDSTPCESANGSQNHTILKSIQHRSYTTVYSKNTPATFWELGSMPLHAACALFGLETQFSWP